MSKEDKLFNLVIEITSAIDKSSDHVFNDIQPKGSSMGVDKNKYYFFSKKDTNNNNKNKYLNIFKYMTDEYKILLNNAIKLYCNPQYVIEQIQPKNTPNPLLNTLYRTDYLLATHFIEFARQKIIYINNSLLSNLDMKATYNNLNLKNINNIYIISNCIKINFDKLKKTINNNVSKNIDENIDKYLQHTDIKENIEYYDTIISKRFPKDPNDLMNNRPIITQNNSNCPTPSGGYKKSVRNKKAKKRTRKSRKNKKTRKIRRKSRRIRRR